MVLPEMVANQTGTADLTGDIVDVPVGEGNAVRGWQLASQRLNLNDQFWGKAGTARAGALVQSSQSFLKEAFSPHADNFATSVKASGNLIIGEATSREQHHPGAHDL